MKRILPLLISVFIVHAAFGQCSPSFTYVSDPTGTELLKIDVTNTTSYTPSYTFNPSFTWDYGDGSGTTTSASHNYAATGTYTVTINMSVYDSATSSISCTNTATQVATISYPACGSTISAVTGTAGLVTYTATTPAGTPSMSYAWTFGDGGTGTGSPATHTYTANGYYVATLTATAPSGCSYTNALGVTVDDVTDCSLFHANFTYSVAVAAVSYNNTSSIAPVSEVRTYLWNFGDGGSSTEMNPIHSFTATGTHHVTLTTNWVDSMSGTVLCHDSVTQVVITDSTFSCTGLHANFTYSNAYSTVTVTNTSTASPVGSSPLWNYGDGSPATSDNSHTYAVGGIYTITLTNTWEDDTIGAYCVSSISLPDTVSDPVNKIYGTIIFTSGPSLGVTDSAVKIWLIKYDTTAMTLYATDSMTLPAPSYSGADSNYYSYAFSGEPAGTYLVKAKLEAAIPGTSGYVPTYGFSSMSWSTANSIPHGIGTDNLNIYMLYGTVPTGPGFIGGTISSGVGKGTSSTHPDSMVIFLRDAATSDVITFAYTNASGVYTFNNLPTGSYNVYPEAIGYTTTPSPTYTITTSSPTASGLDFIQHTGSKTITPVTESVVNVTPENSISIYPNPTNGLLKIQRGTTANTTAHVTITDITDRKAFEGDLIISAKPAELNISQLKDGVYMVTVQTGKYHYTQKITLTH